MLLGKNNEFAFIASFPSSMQYALDETGKPLEAELAEEYETMVSDVRNLRLDFSSRERYQ
jgi:hypothetical protein